MLALVLVTYIIGNNALTQVNISSKSVISINGQTKTSRDLLGMCIYGMLYILLLLITQSNLDTITGVFKQESFRDKLGKG